MNAINPVQSHSLAGLAAMFGLIGLCAAYPETYSPLAFSGGASAILTAMAVTTAAKAYQASVQTGATEKRDLSNSPIT